MGVKELKEMLGFVLGLGNAFGKSMADGKIGWTDLANFLSPLMKAPAAFQGVTQIPGELADLDPTEKAEVLNYVRTEFDIPQDKVEEAVEDGLKLLGDIHTFIKKFF
jgi:hypothetical protein